LSASKKNFTIWSNGSKDMSLRSFAGHYVAVIV